MGRHLSSEETAQVINMYNEGRTQKDIAQHFKVSQATISSKLVIFKVEKRISRKKSTRKPLADSNILEQIENQLGFDPYMTLKELKEELDLPFSKTTISRCVKRTGLRSGISPRKFIIKPADVEKRLNFAHLHRRWSVDDWKRVIFTDEAGLDNSGKFHKRVWRPRGKRFDPRFILKHPNATMSRVNYFSWIAPDGTGDLFFYNRMNSQVYCQIISDMIDHLKEKYETEDFKVIHDNARFSTSRYTKQFLRNKDLEKFFIKIPPYSPDMNIIENAWAILRDRTKKKSYREGQITSKEEFKAMIEQEWSGIEREICENLYQSLPRRMFEIIKSEGQLIKF